MKALERRGGALAHIAEELKKDKQVVSCSAHQESALPQTNKITT